MIGIPAWKTVLLSALATPLLLCSTIPGSAEGAVPETIQGTLVQASTGYPLSGIYVVAIGKDNGRGYGSDALRLGINYSFRELNLYKVQLGVFSYNTRAIRTYEKIGFVREAVQRAMLYRDGQRFDMIEMGILRPEWEAQLTNYEPNG